MFVYDFPTLMVRLQPPAFLTCTQMVFFRSTVRPSMWTSLACMYKLSSFIQPSTLHSLLGVSFTGLFHVVQEVRLRSDYKEIILLKKSRGEGQQTLCCCHCHAEGACMELSSVEDPRWGLWCLIVAAWTCLCLAPTAQGWVGEERERVPRFLEEGDPLFLHVSDQRGYIIIKSRKCFQHSAFSHSAAWCKFPSVFGFS